MNIYESIKDNLKDKEESIKVEEAVDMDRLRDARSRDIQQQNDRANSIRQQIDKDAREVIKKLNAYGYDNLLEVGNYLQEIGLLAWDPISDSKRRLYADGIRHNLGFRLKSIGLPLEDFSIEGGGGCGPAGIIFTNNGYILTNDKCKEELYASVNDIPESLLKYFADLASWANASDSGGVNKFIDEVEEVVNTYADKYPELTESYKEIKEADRLKGKNAIDGSKISSKLNIIQNDISNLLGQLHRKGDIAFVINQLRSTINDMEEVKKSDVLLEDDSQKQEVKESDATPDFLNDLKNLYNNHCRIDKIKDIRFDGDNNDLVIVEYENGIVDKIDITADSNLSAISDIAREILRRN